MTIQEFLKTVPDEYMPDAQKLESMLIHAELFGLHAVVLDSISKLHNIDRSQLEKEVDEAAYKIFRLQFDREFSDNHGFVDDEE